MGGAASRRKGHEFERWLAREFRDALGLSERECRRGLQYQDGQCAPDVVLPGWHVECKRMKRCRPANALEQAIRDNPGGSGKRPVAVTKEDRGPVLVTMLLEDFVELLK